LPHREHEVLRWLAAGLTTKDIATTLSISPITVRNHVTRIIDKLDVKTRLQAVVAASRFGLI
jgi:DNA-binding CsgD family transcriptional regulator